MFLTAGTVNGNGKVMILMMIPMNLLAFLWKLVEEPLNKMAPGQVIKESLQFHSCMQLASPICQQQPCAYNSYDFDNSSLAIADICTPCTKMVWYVKQAAISTKRLLNMSCLKQPGEPVPQFI